MSTNSGPGYWAVIPADVRYDDQLQANAKLLYGEISSLTNERGYCYAQNAFFAKVYGWSVPTIQRLLNALSERGYIRVEIIRNKRTNAVEERRIYAGLQVGVTPPLKNEGRSPQKKGDPPLKNDFANKVYQPNINNPPKAPQGGRRAKSEPTWMPDRFEAFWSYYREHARGEDRAGAVREWDRLKPDEELLRIMGQALRAQVASEAWQRRIGIPYACRWLRNRRWEDQIPAETAPTAPTDERRLPTWD